MAHCNSLWPEGLWETFFRFVISLDWIDPESPIPMECIMLVGRRPPGIHYA